MRLKHAFGQRAMGMRGQLHHHVLCMQLNDWMLWQAKDSDVARAMLVEEGALAAARRRLRPYHCRARLRAHG